MEIPKYIEAFRKDMQFNWNEISKQSGAFKSSPRLKRSNEEAKLQKAICEFIGYQYPNIYYTSDASSLGASWNTIRNIQATKSKHAHLDIILLCPKQGKFHGLILEVKKESPFLKDGTLSKETHIREQLTTMELLRKVNYRCEFIWSLDQAIGIITEYLGEPVTDNSPLF